MVNAAAYNNVDRAEREVEQARRTNALGATVVAAAAERAGLPIVHVSTDYVFDGQKQGAYREDDAVGPINAYGRSKEEGERGVRSANKRHLVLRTSWLFGVYGNNFVKTTLRLAAERDRLGFIDASHGTPTWTADLANAILIAANVIEKGTAPWGTYHVAGSGATSRHQMALAVVAAQERFTGRSPSVEVIAVPKDAAHRPANSALDSSKFAATFGYVMSDWHDAIVRTVELIFASQNAI